ncbi:hypothetical protein V6N13_002063 [Hibiscus sabdariffa]
MASIISSSALPTRSLNSFPTTRNAPENSTHFPCINVSVNSLILPPAPSLHKVSFVQAAWTRRNLQSNPTGNPGNKGQICI